MPSAILNEARAANDPGHIIDHDLVAAIVNRLLAMQAANPAAGATWQPDVGVSTGWLVTLPAGDITVGAVLATAINVYPGMRLLLRFTQDAVGGRNVGWHASFLNPPAINPTPGATTVVEFVNEAVAPGAAGAQWRTVTAPNSSSPTGPAGGALTGTYPSPGIAASAIQDAHIAAGAAIAEAKLALASDAVAATPSRRSLGTGAQQAMPGNAAVASSILAVSRWNPTPGAAITGTLSQGWAVVSTSVLVLTFTAPTSGRVRLMYDLLIKSAVADAGFFWGPISTSTGTAPMTDSTGLPVYMQTCPNGTNYTRVFFSLLLDGLVAGQSYTIWPGWTCSSGNTPSVAAGNAAGSQNLAWVQAVP